MFALILLINNTFCVINNIETIEYFDLAEYSSIIKDVSIYEGNLSLSNTNKYSILNGLIAECGYKCRPQN